MTTRQIRIHVHGRYQYSVTVPETETIQTTAARAAEVMKLGHLRPMYAPGIVNLVA